MRNHRTILLVSPQARAENSGPPLRRKSRRAHSTPKPARANLRPFGIEPLVTILRILSACPNPFPKKRDSAIFRSSRHKSKDRSKPNRQSTRWLAELPDLLRRVSTIQRADWRQCIARGVFGRSERVL